MRETTEFWRHPRFADLGLLKARFTRHRYPLHTHPTYVIAVITEGCERIRVGRRTIIAPAGTIAVVNPEEWHDGEAGAEEGWAYRTFYPSVPLLENIARELGRNGAPLFPRALIEDRDLARSLTAAHRCSTSQDLMSAETSMLTALRHLVLRHGDWEERPEQVERSGSQRRFALYAELIERDLGSELALQHLAQAAGVTRFQVIRDFKKVAGLTPSAFIRDRKLRRAGLLIAQGMALADAAAEAGFADQSHFTRAFRAMHAVTPGLFRNAG
jgi:AraC-like DNA-binding protein